MDTSVEERFGMTFSRMFVGAVVAMLLSTSAHAIVWGTDASNTLMGSRDSDGNGIIGTSDWDDGGFEIKWLVTNLGDGTWKYEYNVEVGRKAVSHSLLELTNEDGIYIDDDQTDPYEGPKDWTTAGNVDLPNTLYGVKFNFGGEEVKYTIVTDRSPVWGNYVAKDGDGVQAWNSGFAANFMTDESLTVDDFIVRPNGAPTDGKMDDGNPDDGGGGPGPGGPGMPEPATAMLALMAAPLLMRRRRHEG